MNELQCTKLSLLCSKLFYLLTCLVNFILMLQHNINLCFTWNAMNASDESCNGGQCRLLDVVQELDLLFRRNFLSFSNDCSYSKLNIFVIAKKIYNLL